MSISVSSVQFQFFLPPYLDKAEQIFLHPNPLYLWNEIVPKAVAQNTFRGYHRVNKACPGAKKEFVNYFIDRRLELIEDLSDVSTRSDLRELSRRIVHDIRDRLSNCSPFQLFSYNKIRKPIDLYIEHLVVMAAELEHVRSKLVPLLFLPLDSQMLAHKCLFTEQELIAQGLCRQSTYKDISTENSYEALQEILDERARDIVDARERPFYVIYFDLIWNDRYLSGGRNLFETNPN